MIRQTGRQVSIASLAYAWLCLTAAAVADSPYQAMENERPVADQVKGALWHDTEWGWIVTDEPSFAAQAASDQREAIAAFYAHFGRVPRRGAIIQSRFAGLFGPLQAHGLQWLVPWRFDTSTRGSKAAHGHATASASALRHEIAHALFLALIVPSSRKGQYGGDAPDWLDEAAAMIAEKPDGIAARREAFSRMILAGRVQPLSTFISAEHPVFGSAAIRAAIAETRRDNPKAPVVLSFNAREVGVDQQTIGDFYAQSRAIFDFLHHRTGNQRILAVIADDYLRTKDPLSWVSKIEAGRNRDDAILALDAAFADWSRLPSDRRY